LDRNRSMDYFLGIDGGGTRTVAWLADTGGLLRGRGEAGPSNPLKVGMRVAQREVLRATRTALRQAGLSVRKMNTPGQPVLRAVCAGISGEDRPEVHRPLLAWMRRHIPARRHLLTTDAAIALAAALRDSAGVLVIAGTGSIACARDEQGKFLRAGGWGVPFDDRGSGYELGRQAVTASLEAYDGRGPSTLLQHGICRQLKLKSIIEIVPRRLDAPQVAALFPLVAKAADDGDLVARHLCDTAGRDLAVLSAALLRRTGWLERVTPVVTTGGVFKSSSLVRNAFARHMHRLAPQARVQMLDCPPVEGAVWLARGCLAGRRRSH